MLYTPGKMQSKDVRESENTSATEIEHLSSGHALSVLLLSTALIFLWALYIRENIIEFPFVFEDFFDLDWFAPYLIGFALQETILPVALLYLFSRSRLFKRLLSERQSLDTIWLSSLALIGLQALVFLYRFALLSRTEDQATIGILLVLAAGIFGGWRAGLSVGIFTSLAVALLNSIVWIQPPDTFTLVGVIENILYDIQALSPIWAGLSIGLISEGFAKTRFHLQFMTLVPSLFVLLSFALMLISTEDPGELVERILPSIAIVALAMLALAMMVRSIENETIRREAESTQLQLAQTQLALSRAELRALHAQINPHFFFNTLNTIRYFVRTDPEVARDLLVKLSDVFQRALQAREFVSLKEELEFVHTYLALEKARLEDRLVVDWLEPDEDLLDVEVPTLILQPIVENAVLHGLAPQEEGGTLRIRARQLNSDLLIDIEDDGQGFDPSANSEEEEHELMRSSIGLNNIDERLQLIYGAEYKLHVESGLGKGTKVGVRIPLRENR